MKGKAPTLEEIKAWPPTVGIREAATALGFSSSHAYGLAQRDAFPVKVIIAGKSIRVVTADLVRVLDAA